MSFGEIAGALGITAVGIGYLLGGFYQEHLYYQKGGFPYRLKSLLLGVFGLVVSIFGLASFFVPRA